MLFSLVLLVGILGFGLTKEKEKKVQKWQMHNFEEEYTVNFDNYWSHEVEVISNKFNNQESLESEETI